MLPRYINPYTDFGFKKLFGEEANKDLLVNFLNAVLPPEHQVHQLYFNNPEQLPNNIVDRKAIFDISCTGEHNESFTVEMQKAKQLYFKDRALFYTSFPVQRQAQKGDWDFRLNPIFLVAILDFEYDEEAERRKLCRNVALRDEDGELFSDKIQMIFLQMPFFNLKEPELVTQRDKWLFFLKNLESFDDIPAILREPIFEKAFYVAEYIKFPPQLQAAYQKDLMAYRDNKNVLDTARDEGFDEGKAEGIVEGEAKRQTEIARNLKQLGVDYETIAQGTGLSINEIKKL
ncbi:MAG: Rpn family recombination-promoting nuclease/putative transposase [Planctomycetaceae bacterium]|jgi:predicted transposase/invertase (TIGR01784 family)|nr:Rpn family recombination-promoting nuclease/putative transposase [Planctomycetaceae bacterium]